MAGDVHRLGEALGRAVEQPALQVLLRREGDRVHQDVEPAPLRAGSRRTPPRAGRAPRRRAAAMIGASSSRASGSTCGRALSFSQVIGELGAERRGTPWRSRRRSTGRWRCRRPAPCGRPGPAGSSSFMAVLRDGGSGAGAARRGDQRRRRRRRRAASSSESARLVRMIGTRAPSTMPAASAPARNDRLLASMLPASRSGTTSTLARPATGESIFLIAAASGLIALSSASGPSSMRAGDLAAVGHLAQRRRLDRRRHLRVDRLHRAQDRDAHLGDAQRMREVDRVLHDVDLVLQRRRDVHRGVGDDQRRRRGPARP